MNYTQVTVVGRLVRNPSPKTTQNGKSLCSSSIAVNSGWGDNERVSYFDFTLWGKASETMVKYCGKGDEVLLSGELVQDTWETDGGERRSTVKISAFRFEFGRKKGEGKGGGGGKHSAPDDASANPFADDATDTKLESVEADDVPF